jgi:DNA-binding NtrC family response regulator
MLPIRAQLTWKDTAGAHALELVSRRTVGSAVHCELVVADRAVSRIHLELDPQPDGLWVRDLGSRNGTHVNGMKVIEARIPTGSVIRVGTTDITVTYADAEPPSEDLVSADHDTRRTFGGLEAVSASMRAVFDALAKLASTDTSIILEGEQGTGKKRLARAIHESSAHAGGPFVVVECAALAWTRSEQGVDEPGLTEALEEALASAEGGTLVLDAPEELPPSVQHDLTSALEERSLRVLATTQRDLRRLVNQGSFWEALYFRLAAATVHVPALRDREGDLPLLLAHFLDDKKDLLGASLLAELELLPWAGNVHELRRYAEGLHGSGGSPFARGHAHRLDPDVWRRGREEEGTIETPTFQTVMGTGTPVSEVGQLLPSALEPWFLIGFKEFRENWIELGEREYLRRLMHRTHRSSGAASREAGLERTYLYRLIKKHGV